MTAQENTTTNFIALLIEPYRSFSFKLVDDGVNVQQSLDGEVFTCLEGDLWIVTDADTGRTSSNDGYSCQESCTLR
jgi:hypothetical protein